MSETILKTTHPVDHLELYKIVEQAYGLGRHDFRVDYDSEKNAVITIETLIDKGAGLSLDITDRGMKAKLSLFPHINEGAPLDNEAVEDFLLDERGLDTELINWDKFKECFDKYTEGYIIYQETIAEGIAKQDGEDARYELHFEPAERKPKILPDGSVDFKSINNIVMVDEGDRLLTYYPETEGHEGKKVTGEIIPAKKGRKITIHKGGGVDYDMETGLYVSTTAGHVTFISGRINVNPVYAVQGDVDYSEGNIDFRGTVTVAGDVLSGFEINAKNIIVRGVARDATLIAEEDITVRTGIFSTGKGVTKAGNTLAATFIEGALVYAGVAVHVRDYCYNSKIFCEGEITVLGGDGIINGGELYAFGSIEAKQIGMENSSSFPLHVGVKHFLTERVDELIQKKDKIEKTLQETDKTIKILAKANPDLKKKEQLRSIIANRSELYKKYEGIDNEIEDMIKKSMHPMPYVMAKKEIHEGIKIVIYSTEYFVPEKMRGAKFAFNQNTGHVVVLKPEANLEYDPRKGRK